MGGRALQTLAAILLAGLWAIALGAGHLRGDIRFLDRIEAAMTDVRTLIRGTRKPPDLITIVAIDDEAVRQADGYPVSRAVLARIIDAIAALKPKVIAVDVLLADPGSDDDDRRLSVSLGGTSSVVAAAAVFAEERQWMAAGQDDPLAGVPRAERFLPPAKIFADVAAVGVVNVATDGTGTPRFVPMLFRAADDRIEVALPLRVASIAAGTDPEIAPDRLSFGQRSVRTDLGHVLPLAFYGPRGTIRTVSASHVLAGRLDKGIVQDRIIVIGATVTGGGDVFPTPFDPVLPGVEVVSTAIGHLVAGDGIVRDRNVRLADVCTAVLLTVLVVALLAWRRSAIGLAAITAVVLFWLGLNVAAFANGVWLSAALPIAAAAPPAILFGAAQLWLDRRRALHYAQQSELLQRIEAPGLGKWLAEHPEFLMEPVRQDVAVVFIDLSGFTGVSEMLGPVAIRDLLNSFHALVDDVVTSCGGVITGFMGDGAMIVFGLPKPAQTDAYNAALCCSRLSERTRQWITSLPALTGSRIGYKIGGHFGTIVASRLGSGGRQHITAAGDTVNVAQRLMEIAAAHGVQVAVSDELLQVAGSESELATSGELSGPFEKKVRGRSGSLAVWLWRGN
jgi:adenylate cyclase